MKKFLSFITIFLLTIPCWADVNISKKHHIQNQEPGRCAWASIETLGLTHGWENLEGLVEKNARGAYRDDIISELNKYKIKYKVLWPEYGEDFYFLMHQKPGDNKYVYVWATKRNKKEVDNLLKNTKVPGYWWIEKKQHWDTSFLRKALDEELGAAVSLDYKGADPKYNNSRHMLVITHMDEDEVHLIDSNYPEGRVRKMPTFEFLEQWNGFAIKLLKKS